MRKLPIIKYFTAAIFTGSILLAVSTRAQVATGGTYKLDQSVIASGGATNSTGGTYALDGTIGEPVAGTDSTGGAFSVRGGFLTARVFAPTAAAASFAGRLETLDGSGLRNALVIVTDSRGVQRSVVSGINGSFRFDALAAGETYIVSVASKRFVFPSQVVFLGENLDEIVIKATAQINFGTPPERVKGIF